MVSLFLIRDFHHSKKLLLKHFVDTWVQKTPSSHFSNISEFRHWLAFIYFKSGSCNYVFKHDYNLRYNTGCNLKMFVKTPFYTGINFQIFTNVQKISVFKNKILNIFAEKAFCYMMNSSVTIFKNLIIITFYVDSFWNTFVVYVLY